MNKPAYRRNDRKLADVAKIALATAVTVKTIYELAKLMMH
jgi:hypothetical protein